MNVKFECLTVCLLQMDGVMFACDACVCSRQECQLLVLSLMLLAMLYHGQGVSKYSFFLNQST